MYSCSIVSREWKTNIKTVFSVMILILLHLVLSTPTEAATAWQRAVVRASDGQVYEIQYTKPLNIENFSIRGLDGTIPSRETAAELYIAAQILNNPSIAAHLYNREELLELVHGEALHTAEWRGYHTLATFVGSVSAGHLVSVVTGALEISASLIESEVGKAVVQALTTTRLIVGEEQVATEAYVVTEAYIEFAFAKRRIFDELVSSAEVGTEVSISDIKAAYNALIQADVYVQYAFWMLDEYLVLPDRWERLWTFAKTIFPPTAIGQYFASFGDNIKDLRNLQTVFAESARRILTVAAAEVDATFSEAEKSKFIWTLASAGFFERQPPTIAAFIEDMQLMVDDDTRLLDLTTKFSDLNGDRLEHTVEVTDSTVADVALILFVPDGESTSKPFLEITPKRVGATSVTIQATDPTRLSATQTFTITVDPASLPNQPPEAVNTIPVQSLTLGSASPPLDASVYFHDPDGGTIFYTAESSNPAVATTQRTGSQLTILPQGIGTATITITAANSDGVSDTQTFTVIVTVNETPTERPTPQGLSNGDAIIVQNTGNGGLNIRSAPQVRNQNPDNRIGLVYDGAMGTITAGPRESDDGYIWWEVQWDASNNRGWSVESIGEIGLLARRPPEPVTHSFDLEIQPLSVSKQTLDAGESFTLSITIHNNGPGNSPGPALSYYHSLSPGFSPTDPPQLQGTLSVGPLASGESRTQSIQLVAPSTPKTYYYGAWLAANTGDTYLNNDVATEIAVTVSGDTHPDPVDTSDPPDLVITNISVDYETMYPGERFTISATVRNAGGRQAANARVRYYSSSDEIYSTDDEELPNTTDFIGRLEGGERSNETANLDAPDEQGVYYYIARAEPVQNEVDTDNNYAAIKITVLPPAAPDLVVSLLVPIWGRGKITSRPGNEYFIDPDEFFRLEATINNQGAAKAEATSIHFYRSLDPIPSPERDEFIETKELREFRDPDSRFYDPREQWSRILAPEKPGTYYYYACVDSVPGERYTDNNCSNVVTLKVRGPDLVVYSVSVDYHSRTNTVYPNGIFDLDITVRNQGTEDADDTILRYYISSDPILSSDDTEVATDRVFSLDMNETSKTYKENWIRVPYTSGFFYALVCVDGVEAETDTANNCYTPIKITVTNFGPRAEGAIPEQMLYVGTSAPLDVSAYFVDTNNDDLTYTASSSAPNIVTVGVSGAQVTFTPHRNGRGTITVTASDGEFTATQTVSVSVVGAEAWIPDASLRAAVRAALGLQPNDALTQQALDGLIILNASSSVAGTGVQNLTGLEHATQLTILNLGRTGVRNLTPVQGLTQLTQLNLIYTEISDLTPLQGLTNLTTLNLLQTRSTNITPLQGLINLTSLNLERIGVRDLTPLRGLTALTSLNLSFNNANGFNTPGDLTPLSGLTALTSLNLGYTDINNITALKGLTALTYLDLKNNQISDVTALEGLTALKNLYLSGNPIADLAPLRRLKENNPNISIDVDIEIEAPDLLVDSVRVNKTTVAPGETFRLHAVVKNQGEADASAITARYYQSTDETISATDAELSTATLGLIAVDGTNEPSVQLTAPDTPGIYYYGICVDEVTDETDTNNNCSVAVAVTVEGAADLVIDSVRAGNTTVNPSQNFRLTAAVRNQGKATATPTVLHYYRSTDDTISATDTLLTTLDMAALAADANSEPSAQLTAPEAPGTYYYGVCIDEVASETDTTNNCSQAIAITVEGADLMIQGTPQVSKTTLALGETFQIETRIWNQGKAASGATTLRYYLSTDETISPEDTEVASDRVDALSGRGASANRRRVDLSKILTAPDTPGTHYYGVCVDSVAGDANTLNNCSQAIAITVEAPPPEPVSENIEAVDIKGPDLIISTVRVDASTIKQGGGVRFHITLTNQGTDAAPATIIRYYRSTDATISTEDTELRAVPVGGLGAGKSYTTWALLPSPFAVGAFYYGACLDTVTSEFDTLNNCSDAIEIIVVLQSDPIDGLESRGRIPAQTLKVEESPEPLSASRYFAGKVDTWETLSSKPAVVTVSMEADSDLLKLTPVSRGHSVVTVTAHHGDTTAEQTFDVYVGIDPTLVLRWVTPVPPQPLAVGGSPLVLDLSRNVTGQVETWKASSSNEAFVSASLSGSVVTLTPVSEGNAEVTIHASDGTSEVEHTFRVFVGAAGEPDLKWVIPVPPQTLVVGRSPVVLDVSGYVAGEVETWEAVSSNETAVTASLSGAVVTLTPGSEGSSEVTISARRGDLEVSGTFTVSVAPDSSPEVSIPDANLRAAVRSALGLAEGDTITQQKMAGLTSLEASSRGIQNLTGLEHATQLTRLNLHNNSQLSNIAPLKGLNTLTHLDLSRIGGFSDITLLTGLTGLTELRLGGNQISDISPLENLPILAKLHISQNQISDITPLLNISTLTHLGISNNPINDITPFANLTNLTWLSLDRCEISDLTPLANLTGLSEELYLRNNDISDITPIANLTALQQLRLSHNKISDITPIVNLPLIVLDINHNDISDITPIANLTTLTHLEISKNKISDVTSLENLLALMFLWLDGNPIEDFAPLRSLKEKNPSVQIDIDINADLNNAPLAPSAPVLPDETALLSNYPNPFNPETWIPYQLATSADVTLTIYDVRGVMVWRLALGHRPAGFYRSRGRAAHWDGRNQIGEKVATGLYFYTLTAGDFNATGKMLIQK